MAMSEPEMDAFYNNILALCSILGILIITLYALFMIWSALTRRKKFVRSDFDFNSYIVPETGALSEEKHVRKVIVETPKNGPEKTLIVDEYVINRVTTDSGLIARNEQKFRITNKTKKLLIIDWRGRLVQIEEHHMNINEYWDIPKNLIGPSEAVIAPVQTQKSAEQLPVNSSQLPSTMSRQGDVADLKVKSKDGYSVKQTAERGKETQALKTKSMSSVKGKEVAIMKPEMIGQQKNRPKSEADSLHLVSFFARQRKKTGQESLPKKSDSKSSKGSLKSDKNKKHSMAKKTKSDTKSKKSSKNSKGSMKKIASKKAALKKNTDKKRK